jgi:hypothetical protein
VEPSVRALRPQLTAAAVGQTPEVEDLARAAATDLPVMVGDVIGNYQI